MNDWDGIRTHDICVRQLFGKKFNTTYIIQLQKMNIIFTYSTRYVDCFLIMQPHNVRNNELYAMNVCVYCITFDCLFGNWNAWTSDQRQLKERNAVFAVGFVLIFNSFLCGHIHYLNFINSFWVHSSYYV